MFLAGDKILAEFEHRHAHAVRARQDHITRNLQLRSHHQRRAFLDDARFFARDRGEIVAQKFLVIQTHRLDHRHGGVQHHIGGVIGAAQSHFQHHRIGGIAGESQEHRRRGDLEKGDLAALIDLFHLFQQRHQPFFGDQFAGDADALMEFDQMRRGMDMHPQALRFQHGAGKGAHTAFAIGAGDMDHRRQAVLRITQRGEQAKDAVQRQIDLFGVQ
jgi:hypothetical protein